MPRKPRTPCPVPGCPELTTGGRCATHKAQDRKARAQATQAYGTSAWQRTARAYLYAHPWCVLCGRAATVPDHHPTSRRDLVAAGVADPDAWHRMRPLCKTCHDKETARLQPGGWAAEARSQREARERIGRPAPSESDPGPAPF